MALLKQTVRKNPHANILQDSIQTFIIHHELAPQTSTHDATPLLNVTTPITLSTNSSNSTSTSTPIYELGKHLLNAAKNGNINEIKSLMGRGAAFTPDWLGACPLHYAASNGHVQACEILLRAGISRNSRTKVERTPLHMAVYEGHIDVVETLIKHGADINAKDMLQMTPLQWAVQRCNHDNNYNGDLSMVQCLLKHGAKVKMENKFGNTALDIAQQLENIELIELVEKTLTDQQQLEQATELDEVEQIDQQSLVADQARKVNEYLNDVVPLSNMNAQVEVKIDQSIAQQETKQQREVTIEDCIDNDDENVKRNLQNVVESTTEGASNHKMSTDNGYCSSTSVDQSTNIIVDPTSDNIDLTNDESALVDIDADPYRLLRQRYGIELLPEVEEDGGRILKQAMNSGHTVSLTEAGKKALNLFKLQEEQQQQTGADQQVIQQHVSTTTTKQLKKQVLQLVGNNLTTSKVAPSMIQFSKLQKQRLVSIDPDSANIMNTTKRKRIFTTTNLSNKKGSQIVFLQGHNNNNNAGSKLVPNTVQSTQNVFATAKPPFQEVAGTITPNNVPLRQTKQIRERKQLQQQQQQETTLLTLTTDEFAGLQANGGFVTTNNGVYKIMDYNHSPVTNTSSIKQKRTRGSNNLIIGDSSFIIQPEIDSNQCQQESETIKALRHQLQEQRHLVDVYKRKYLKKEAEAERFKQQLKLMLKHRSSNKIINTGAIYNNNENNSR